MNNKYTIIDNFDKLDFYSMITTPAYSDVTDTPSDVVEVMHRTKMAKYNRSFGFSKSMDYIPDMLRYITGLRFIINKNGNLVYPPKKPTNENTYPEELAAHTPGGAQLSYWKRQKFAYFDLLHVDTNFDGNNHFFGNTLRIEDYYDPALATESHIPPYLQIGKYDFEYALKGIRWHRKSANASKSVWWRNVATIGYTRNYILFSPSLATEMTDLLSNGFVEYFTTNPATASPLLTAFATYAGWRDVLQKLLLMKVNKLSSDAAGNTIFKNKTRHLYFVAHLLKGTSEYLEEFDYTNDDYIVVAPKYNYFAQYAEIYPENVKTEWQLPNLYTYYNLLTNKDAPIYYKILATLGMTNIADLLAPSTEVFTVSQYFKEISKSNIEELTFPEDVVVPVEAKVPTYYRYKTIIIDDKESLAQANAIAHFFPMYNKITIPSKGSGFMQIMKENNLIDDFVTLLGSYFSSYGGEWYQSAIHNFVIANESEKEEVSTRVSNSALQIMDLGNLYRSGTSAGKYKKYFDNESFVKFGFNKNDFYPDPATIISNLYDVKGVIFEYLNNKKLSIKEIYEGDKCHTEPLMYEIAKFKFINGVKTHLQSIFMPCILIDEDISYIDTQVFYEEEYIYEIFTHSLIVGSKYYIERVPPPDDQKALESETLVPLDKQILQINPEIKEINDIAPIIVRAPYYNNTSLTNNVKITKISDSPPLPPDIVFNPYKDDDEKILVSLNIEYGERNLLPIAVFKDDIEKINQYKEEQQSPQLKQIGYVTYKTDDVRGTFQIYRTTKKPSGWADFQDANLKELNVMSSSGYNDFILPNTDYYYFARLIDVHNNISNPTAVFYVRIIKEGGFPPYLVTHVYDFSQAKEAPKYDKSFKKYLKLKLADGTRELINQDNIWATGLGYKKASSKSTQLKKYKIRITSKKTGKKIDLNLDFTKSFNTVYLDKQSEISKQLENLDEATDSLKDLFT